MTDPLPPIACSLPLREAASQVMEWTDLEKHVLASEEIPNGMAVVYPLQMADQVEDLARRESACCAWLSIATRRMPEGVRVELSSDHPDAGPVISVLAGRS